jgi:nucleotide-binding universal stress UspA family protein
VPVTKLASTGDVGDRLEIELGAAADRGAGGARQVIVLATSGSPASIRATVFAAQLAGIGAVLRIVHVIAPVEYRVGRLAPMRPVQRRLTDPFQSPVLRQARELAWRHGSAVSLQLVAGDPPASIIAAAHDAFADVLVIGGRPQARWRVAPTRRWVQARAPCRVFTTPTGGKRP